MKLSHLLQGMDPEILFCQIAMDELPNDACVMPLEKHPSSRSLYALRPEEAVRLLSHETGSHLNVFCAGALPEGYSPPAESNVVCFRASCAQLFSEAQRAFQKLRYECQAGNGQGSLLANIIEGKVQGGNQAGQLLQSLGIQSDTRFCLCALSFFGRLEDVPWEKVEEQFTAMIPHSVSYRYKCDILFLTSLEPSEILPVLDIPKLQLRLEEYNAYLAVSNNASRPMAIRVQYNQVKTAARFGIALRDQESKRIFIYEDYANYQIVEFCAEAYRNDLQVSDLVYLCHPALGSVLRYDRANGTNMAQLLRCYLDNDCNVSQTARESFIHRNTMLNKLDKLREILGVSMKDANIREQLRFSFHVVDYVEQYMHGTIF
ncbi:MAG: helix-turn-helix domain-containing protein [Firmicutes bacterium]|nr:helix-turn-helix domain-containing protein [Bacillota bacterium]